MSKQEAKVVNLTEETTVENVVEETVETTDTESTNVIVEAEPKFYEKALAGIQKHGKKIAGAALLAGLGIVAYALGKKAGSDDDYDYDYDYDSMTIDFGGSDDVVADADYTVTDSDVTTEE